MTLDLCWAREWARECACAGPVTMAGYIIRGLSKQQCTLMADHDTCEFKEWVML